MESSTLSGGPMLKQNWAMARPAQPKSLKSGKKNWPKNAKIYGLLWAGPPNNCAVVSQLTILTF
jgi:hypothetical protein